MAQRRNHLSKQLKRPKRRRPRLSNNRPHRADSIGSVPVLSVRTKGQRGLAEFHRQRTTINANIYADIKRIRLMWAKGWTDIQIRRTLNLNWSKWKNRLRVMRAVPPDEDVIRTWQRYFLENEKFKARQEIRLRRLTTLYTKATEEVTVSTSGSNSSYTRPRDLKAAKDLQVAMGEIDERIRTAEAQLVILKQRLGVMDDHGGGSGIGDMPFTSTNIRDAWERRNRKRQQIEDAMIVRGSNNEEL